MFSGLAPPGLRRFCLTASANSFMPPPIAVMGNGEGTPGREKAPPSTNLFVSVFLIGCLETGATWREKVVSFKVKGKRRPFSVNCFTLSILVKHFIVPLRLKRSHPWHLFPESTSPTPLSLHDSVDNLVESLRNCSLQGAVPDLSRILSLSYMDLSHNLLSGPIPSNKLSDNMTTMLEGNPVCRNANLLNTSLFCGSESGEGEMRSSFNNSKVECPKQSCPADNSYEYVPESPIPCFCAAPLRIGYRLKSPSFLYFHPFVHSFENYLTDSLNFSLYQLLIDAYFW